MSEPKHTPWTLTKTPARIEVRHAPDAVYAFSHGDEASAQMIVRAVNSHARMVEALETIAGVWDEHPGDVIAADDILNPHWTNIRDVVRAALAAGRGEA